MEIHFQCGGTGRWKAAVMLLPLCKGEQPGEACPVVVDGAPWLSIAPAARDFSGEELELALLHGHPDLDIPRVLALGLGPREACTPARLRKAVGSALAFCREHRLESVLLPVAALERLPGDVLRLTEDAVCGALLGLYRFTACKTPDAKRKKDPARLSLAVTEEFVPEDIRAAARRGEYTAAGAALARDLANTPPNLLSPEALAAAAVGLAQRHALCCEVLDETQLAELGCNALLAVGQGSRRPPRMVILEYAPRGHEQDDPLVLVGKGLCFDSGGICLKPAANMHTMKSDMSGAAAVLGVLEALALGAVPCRVTAVLACAENMPGGNAMRPGDVVKSFSGKTVEILNTDAEGRLALCDALSYAQQRWKPKALIDIATLTGACAVALGNEIAGLFCNDDALAQDILNAGMKADEPFWRLPLWEPYERQLKSEVADISHMGSRQGGAINAALYLKHFIHDGVRWAHLDIAGVDWIEKATPLCPVGAAGFGVRALLELVRKGAEQ